MLGLCASLAAQNTESVEAADTFTADQLRTTGALDAGSAFALLRPDLFDSVDGSVLIHSLPVMTLLDGRRFPISGDLGRMGFAPLGLFPVAFLQSAQVHKVGASPMLGSEAPGGIIDLRLNRSYSGGEVGVFYGKSSGKYGREDFGSYVVGTVGNDKLQITAGASYQESSGHIPRFGR